MKKLIFAFLFLNLIFISPAFAHIGIVDPRRADFDVRFLKEEFSPDFLEKKNCGYVNPAANLSRDPNDPSKPSNQTQVRMMVQMRNFECMTQAFAETREAIEAANISPEKKRVAFNQLKTAEFWWQAGAGRYIDDVLTVLNSPGPTLKSYTSDNADYGWAYTGHGMEPTRGLIPALTIAYGSVDKAPVSASVKAFLTASRSLPSLPKISGTPVISQQVYFNQHFLTDDPLAAERREAIERIEMLHREAGDALLCEKKTGQPCPGGRSSAAASAEMNAVTLDATRRLNVPFMIPFAKGYDKKLSYEDLCRISQKVELGHGLWHEGLMHGDTPEGFRQAWIGMIAHSLGHIQRRTGEQNIKTMWPELIAVLERSVPGVSADGSCSLDEEHIKEEACGHVIGQPSVFPDHFDRMDCSELYNGWKQIWGDFNIQNNRLVTRNGMDKHLAVIPELSCPSQEVSANFSLLTNSSGRFGVILRYQDPGNYYYFYRSVGGSSRYIISKFVNGKEIGLRSVGAYNPRVNAPFQLTGKAFGTTLTLEVNGVQVLSVSDTEFNSGSVGVFVNTFYSQSVDDFDAKVTP